MAKNDTKKSSAESGIDPNGWMVTFSDLITLLLTFFVLLLTMSSMDAKSFREAFTMIVSPVEVLETTGGGTFIEPIMILPTAPDAFEPLTTEENVILTFEEIIKRKDLQPVRLYNTEHGVILRVEEQALFDAGRAELKPEAQALLDELLPALSRVQFPIIVEGHTGRFKPPAAGGLSSEWDLSSQRALNTLLYLLEHSTLKAEQASLRGYNADSIARNPQFGASANYVEIVIDTLKTTKKRGA